MTVKDIEESIKKYTENLPETDEDKSELFEYCYKLARFVSNYKARFNTVDEHNEFTFYLAEEIYMLVMKGKKLEYWASYMVTAAIGYIEDFQKFNGYNRRQNEDVLIDPNYPARYNKIGEPATIEKSDIVRMLLRLYNEARYYLTRNGVLSSKNALYNAKLSFILSVKYKHFVNFRLNEVDESFCRFLYNKFKQEFIKIVLESRDEAIMDDRKLGIMSWLQFYNPYDEED